MTLHYTLNIEDHLAWYDTHDELFRCGPAAIPVIGWLFRWEARSKFKSALKLPASSAGFGERSIEITDRGIREFNERFDFFVPWCEIAVAVTSKSRLFLARPCRNAFVVPLAACDTTNRRVELFNLLQINTKLRESHCA